MNVQIYSLCFRTIVAELPVFLSSTLNVCSLRINIHTKPLLIVLFYERLRSLVVVVVVEEAPYG